MAAGTSPCRYSFHAGVLDNIPQVNYNIIQVEYELFCERIRYAETRNTRSAELRQHDRI